MQLILPANTDPVSLSSQLPNLGKLLMSLDLHFLFCVIKILVVWEVQRVPQILSLEHKYCNEAPWQVISPVPLRALWTHVDRLLMYVHLPSMVRIMLLETIWSF